MNNNSRFREDKAIAVLTYLLQLSDEINDKYWLNKVMYYIEKESIIRYGEPVFHDDLYSMPYGPVVSSVKEGIDSADSRIESESKWKKFIRLNEADHEVFLIAPGDFSLLSESEIEIITEAYEKFKDYSFTKIMGYFHSVPEYEEIHGYPRRKKITYEDLFIKNNFSPDEASEIIEEIAYSEKAALTYG